MSMTDEIGHGVSAAQQPQRSFSNVLGLAGWAGLLALAVLMIVLNQTRPLLNWDSLAYVGAMERWAGVEPREAHRSAYDQLREKFGDQKYRAIANGDYRRAMALSHGLFEQELRFYTVRPLYILSAMVLDPLTGSGFTALLWVSLVSGLALALMTFLLVRRFAGPAWTPLVPLLFLAVGAIVPVRVMTPDTMAAAASMACFMALLYGKPRLALILAVVMIGCRTDLVALALLVCALIAVTHRPLRMAAGFAALVAFGTYGVIHEVFDYPGWQAVYYVAFIELLPVAEAERVTLAMSDIIRVTATQLTAIPTKQSMVYAALILLLGVAAAWPFRKTGETRMLGLLALTGAAYIAARLVIFPMLHDRFFLAEYLLFGVLLLHGLSRLMAKAEPVKRAR